MLDSEREAIREFMIRAWKDSSESVQTAIGIDLKDADGCLLIVNLDFKLVIPRGGII